MPHGGPNRELSESRLHVLDGASPLWRSPLFVFGNHCLLFFQTLDLSRARSSTLTSRRFVGSVGQLVDNEWLPLHITGSGGGGSDDRMVHWIELELPDHRASAIRISYGEPALAAVDDWFSVSP